MGTSLFAKLESAQPNTLPDAFRQLHLGRFMAQGAQALRKTAPAANATLVRPQLATLSSFQLPDFAKACIVRRAYVRAGGVTGELTPVAYGATPATTQIAVAPNGDIVTLEADAITNMDVEFEPLANCQAIQLSNFPVLTSDLTLPSSITALGVIYLVEANAITATATGKKIVLVPGAGVPAAGRASLNVARDKVRFQTTDAVTTATVTLIVGPSSGEDPLALLAADTVLE
jgi:hypothetical protein